MKNKNTLVTGLLLIGLIVTGCNGGKPSSSSSNINTSATDSIIDVDDKLDGFFKGYGEVADIGRTEPVYNGEEVLVSKVINNGEKVYLEVEGQPFLYLGAQIRTDAYMNTDFYTYEELERLFEEAAKLGVTSVQIPVEWKDIEVKEDEWDFSYLHAVLTFANKYNLKMELLWFGTNMVGDSHSYTIPDYILKDGKTYPKYDAKRTGEFWNYYGIMWYMDFDNPNLMAKEANAAKKMMEYVYEWDSTHGGKKPVIGVQILNEADAFARWRINTYDVINPATGVRFTEEEAFAKIRNSLDYIGKAVKSTKYKVYTRTNFADSTQGQIYSGGNFNKINVRPLMNWAKAILDLEGIDIVGDDAYKSNIKDIKGIAYMYSKNAPGNFGHIAENDGNYSNTPSLILVTTSLGVGYSIYDLATSPFFVTNSQMLTINQGIIVPNADRKTFTYKSHYEKTKQVLAGLKAVNHEAVLASSEDFAVFNVQANNPSASVTQTITTSKVIMEFNTSKSAVGFGIYRDGYVTLFVTDDSTVKLSGNTFSDVEIGYYNTQGNWVKETAGTLGANNLVNLTANKVYRVKVEGSNTYTSNTWDYIG